MAGAVLFVVAFLVMLCWAVMVTIELIDNRQNWGSILKWMALQEDINRELGVTVEPSSTPQPETDYARGSKND